MARTGLSATACGGRIFVLGGHDGETTTKTFETFTPNTDDKTPDAWCDRGEWCEMPHMLARRAYLTADVLGKQVFAVGGSADGRMLNTVEVFDIKQNCWAHWFTMPPMQTKRTLHGSAVGDGKLFICGGCDGIRDMATCECYDPGSNSWEWKDRMEVGRSDLAVAAAGGSLYAIGGQNRLQEDGPRAHATVEVFNFYSERWSSGLPLHVGRIGLTAATIKDDDGLETIYVCGGSDGTDVLATVECYDLQTCQWIEAPSMNVPRLGHASVVVNNRLYVIGGSDGKVPLDTFECFDPVLQKWGPLQKIGVGADDS